MRQNLLHIIVTCCLLFCIENCFSQTTQTIIYTTKDGLPSNSIYRTLLDKRGFLWIATDIGLSRFDGKIFKTYTTAQGLPDNEIVDLMMDSSGIVWAVPFGKTPSYYNLLKDRFENSGTDPQLKKIDAGNTNAANVLLKGGIAFTNNHYDIFIYKNGITNVYKDFFHAKMATPIKIYEVNEDKLLLVCGDAFRYIVKGKIVQGKPINTTTSSWCERVNNILYIGQKNTITKVRVDENGETENLKVQTYPFEIRMLGYTGKQLTITSINDITYLLNPETLELSESIPGGSGANVRNVLQDNYGNSWLSTRESGLIKVQQKRISSFTALPALQQNFNAIARSGNMFIAGNNKGEIYTYDGVYDLHKTALTTAVSSDAWVRKIIPLKNGIYVATQTGSYLFNKTGDQVLQTFTGTQNKSTKAALLMNDSTLVLGNHAIAYKVRATDLGTVDSVLKRVVSLAADNKGRIYIGSSDGLYCWEGPSLYYFGKQQKGLTYKINTMCNTPDGFMFIGPGSDSLFILKDKQLVKAIALGDIIPGNTCKSLYCNKAGEVWLGTNKGLNRLRYVIKDKEFTFSNTAFGTADGLSGEQVNDIFIHNDTVYMATNGGISFLPATMKLPVADITTFITRVTVDAKDTIVAAAYELPYDKNDVTIEFSAVDLTGYYPVFQYNINDGNWLRLERNVLELRRLASGQSNIKIRAIKRDGTPSPQEASVNINIRTPFWKNSIFWSVVGMAVFILCILLLQKRNKQKQKTAVEKVVTEKKLSELEMQALKAQINPHFVFNCLNSIKGFIYDKDFDQADKYLDRFSELLRSTLDNSSSSIISLEDEISYLDNYLQLEKLRFDDKFDYFVQVEDGVDKKNSYVPAMLLQPYVENAIRHGIRHLQNKKGQIGILISRLNYHLICTIDDNGVGRDKATELRNELHTEYQSRGMQLSKRRAELYHIEQDIVDKKDKNGIATGTTIILRIPLSLKP